MSKKYNKCIKYIKTMISKNKWPINEKIPTIINICKNIKVSYPIVRKSIKYFEQLGIIENYGSLGFFIKENRSKQHKFTKELKINVEAADMLSDNAEQIKNWIIKFDKKDNYINALNIISGLKLRCLYTQIINILKHPIKLDDLLQISDKKILNRQLSEYKQQQKLLPLATLLYKTKKEVQNECNLY